MSRNCDTRGRLSSDWGTRTKFRRRAPSGFAQSRGCNRDEYVEIFPPVRAKTTIISGFLRWEARRDWVSRGHPVRRVTTPGNGAVAHRACVTLLRAYNHPHVSLSPVPWLGLFPLCSMARIFPSRLHCERSSSTFRGAWLTLK